MCSRAAQNALGGRTLPTPGSEPPGKCNKGVCHVIMTSQLKIFLKLHYLTDDNRYLLKRKPASDFSHFKNFICLGSKVTSQSTLYCTICILFFLKKYSSQKRDKTFF